MVMHSALPVCQTLNLSGKGGKRVVRYMWLTACRSRPLPLSLNLGQWAEFRSSSPCLAGKLVSLSTISCKYPVLCTQKSVSGFSMHTQMRTDNLLYKSVIPLFKYFIPSPIDIQAIQFYREVYTGFWGGAHTRGRTSLDKDCSWLVRF